MNDLIKKINCPNAEEKCFTGECDNCPVENLVDILSHNNDIDYDEECFWNIWKKANNKFDLQQIIGSVDSLLTDIEDRWDGFLLHVYCNRQQRDYIKHLREISSNKTFLVAQIDFSMNYTLVRQREVQQGFFTQHQVSLFTIHITVGQEQRNVAVISNHMEHTTAFVYSAQKILVHFIKKNFPLVQKINYVRYILVSLRVKNFYFNKLTLLCVFFCLVMVLVHILKTTVQSSISCITKPILDWKPVGHLLQQDMENQPVTESVPY